MTPRPSKESIVKDLLNEISIITGTPAEQTDPEQSLAANGINSMGFVELLLCAKRRWQVNLIECGIGTADVKSVRALAERILSELDRA